jgi:hypothetical protein
MLDDTGIGGSRDKFSTTRSSAIAAVRSDDPAERTRAGGHRANA